MSKHPGAIKITVDTTRLTEFIEAMRGADVAISKTSRSLNRHFAQIRRNQATGPLSDERREIQAIGRREMAEAVAEFDEHRRSQRYPSSITLPPIADGEVVISSRDPYLPPRPEEGRT